MTSPPRVSVVMTTYRSAAHVRSRLPRLLRQTRRDIEVVVVDDGSGDDTADVARTAADGDPRVRVVALPENGGVARARRRGVAESTGEFVWFVDDDDDWPDDALDRLLAATGPEIDTVVAGATFHYRDGSRRRLAAPDSPPVSGADAFRMLLRGRITGHLWNKLFRRETIARASFAPARVQSDLAMTGDALSHSRSVAFVAAAVYDYRLRDGSIITTSARRSDSLEIVDAAIDAAAARTASRASDDHRYFRARYIRLSGIKDALLADYPPPARRALLRRHRAALRWRDVALLAQRRDARRLLLAVTAKTSWRLHRLVLRIAER